MKDNTLQVQIFGINYFPEVTGIGPYTTGLAEFLADEGHCVSVVTGFPSYPQWRIRPPYRRLLWRNETRNGVNLRRRWNYVPTSQTAVRRALYELTFLLSGLTGLKGGRPDLIIGVIPSMSGGVLARLGSHWFKVPYCLVFQDLMGLAALQSGMEGGVAVSRWVARIEQWVIRRASSAGVIAEGFKPYVAASGMAETKIYRLRNWTVTKEPTEERLVTRKWLGIDPQDFVCVHAGNMGLKQELNNVIECARLAEAAAPGLRFLMVGDGSQRALLEDLTESYGLKNLTFVPVLPDDDFPNVLAAADVLLLNQSAAIADMALPSKLTAYLASGRAVVAAVAPDSETAREILASGGGELVPPASPEALLAKITELASDPDRLADLGRRGKDYAQTRLSVAEARRLFFLFLEDLLKA
ncbi:MAG TPA: glycosyltransferase [Actinomycetota bacterium]|nr:glycosyltransferase [Actinomycetota bacterium]